MEKIGLTLKKSKMTELGSRYSEKDIIRCPICGDPINKIVKMHFGEILVPVNCRCKSEKIRQREIKEQNNEKQTRLKRILSNSMMNEKFKKCTLENWDHAIGNEKLFKIANYYINNFKKMKEENKGLLIHGEPGNGKTYSAACIANKLLAKQIPTTCIGAVALIERIEKSKKLWGDEAGIFTVLNTLQNADLLIIDDLGTEPDIPWTRSMLYQIIEKRNSSELPIIITTNIRIDELKERYDYRTYSRLTEMCSFIGNTGNDIRKIKGREKTSNFLKELLS
ncbi:ATP-binding protein [Clostridium massiliodielmoense]|uniref:ATP-binding protein n=1 Tax=Clostridium massiliodielmoense TaxID=1776385 RepID=UPI001FA8C963|nr:ATP-binding protein [Clostridium massiliodielmoense]